MKNILLLGALALFAFTASAQSDTPACTEKAKTEKVCAKTGEKCSETCANKKTGTCCEGKSDAEKKSCSSKEGDKKSCCSQEGGKKSCSSKEGDKKSCSSKEGDKKSCCSKEGDKKSCSKSGDASPTKGDKKKGDKNTQTKTVGMSK